MAGAAQSNVDDAAAGAAASSAFHLLKVASVTPETDHAVCIAFEVPEALAGTFAFTQGQYLTLRATIDGDEVRRSYSICSGVTDGELKVGIKHIDGGVFSTWANEALKAGDTLEVMAPQGEFHTALAPEQDKNYLMIAAGSGITPILSIVKSVLEVEPHSHVTLLYGNRSTATVMFREALEQLKNQHMARFQLINILSREQRDVEILNGHIDNRKGAELCRHILDLNAVDEFFLCGPEAMISEVSRGLRAEGIAEEKIHYELFGASAADAAQVLAKHRERAAAHAGQVCNVTLRADGRETRFDLTTDGENILDGGIDNGVDLPYACKGGVCATCKARLVEGQVDMDLNHALEQDEVEAGYILTCQAHPLTDVVVDFDA